MLITPIFGIPYAEPDDPVREYPNTVDAPAKAIIEAQLAKGGAIFADAATRDTAIPVPVEGQRCFRTDLNRGEVYSGTAWRVEFGLMAHATGRFAIAHTAGPFTLTAGVTQALDLSLAGMLTGQIFWASGVRIGSTGAFTVSVTALAVTAAQFHVRNETGAVAGAATGLNIVYMAALAY